VNIKISSVILQKGLTQYRRNGKLEISLFVIGKLGQIYSSVNLEPWFKKENSATGNDILIRLKCAKSRYWRNTRPAETTHADLSRQPTRVRDIERDVLIILTPCILPSGLLQLLRVYKGSAYRIQSMMHHTKCMIGHKC
jgi:hypothetical protein